MLSILLFLPAATGLVLLALPGASDRALLRAWVGISAVEVGLAVALWIGFVRRDHPGGGVLTGIAQETNVQWIPSAGSGYHIGVDGLSLPLVALTAVLFLACAIYALREDRRVRSYVVLFLFLETVGEFRRSSQRRVIRGPTVGVASLVRG
jgi:NADH-quinone oxidoreductase subunit M